MDLQTQTALEFLKNLIFSLEQGDIEILSLEIACDTQEVSEDQSGWATIKALPFATYTLRVKDNHAS